MFILHRYSNVVSHGSDSIKLSYTQKSLIQCFEAVQSSHTEAICWTQTYTDNDNKNHISMHFYAESLL